MANDPPLFVMIFIRICCVLSFAHRLRGSLLFGRRSRFLRKGRSIPSISRMLSLNLLREILILLLYIDELSLEILHLGLNLIRLKLKVLEL